MIKYSFAPVIDERCKVIIIGSLPSEQSIKKQQYYGNPKNYFWKVIYALFDAEPENEYDKRCEFLKAHKIALWDAAYSARNINSLDANIKDEVPNDFERLFKEYPEIKYIFFNGAKAESIFKKYFSNINIPSMRLCSTSPIPTRYAKNLEDRLEVWKVIKQTLSVV